MILKKSSILLLCCTSFLSLGAELFEVTAVSSNEETIIMQGGYTPFIEVGKEYQFIKRLHNTFSYAGKALSIKLLGKRSYWLFLEQPANNTLKKGTQLLLLHEGTLFENEIEDLIVIFNNTQKNTQEDELTLLPKDILRENFFNIEKNTTFNYVKKDLIYDDSILEFSLRTSFALEQIFFHDHDKKKRNNRSLDLEMEYPLFHLDDLLKHFSIDLFAQKGVFTHRDGEQFSTMAYGLGVKFYFSERPHRTRQTTLYIGSRYKRGEAFTISSKRKYSIDGFPEYYIGLKYYFRNSLFGIKNFSSAFNILISKEHASYLSITSPLENAYDIIIDDRIQIYVGMNYILR